MFPVLSTVGSSSSTSSLIVELSAARVIVKIVFGLYCGNDRGLIITEILLIWSWLGTVG